MTYSEKLKDPRWQKKRLEIFEAANWGCENCGDRDKTLNVHHKTYEKGKDPWDYPNHNYLCLCSVCHKQRHETTKLLSEILSYLDTVEINRIIGYASSILSIMSGENKIPCRSYEEAEGVADFFWVDVEKLVNLVSDNFIDTRKVL